MIGKAQRHIDASIIPAGALQPVGLWMKRVFAFTLVLLSLYGTYVQAQQFGGGAGGAVIIAILFQLVVSVAQFAFRQQWQSIWYVGALLASVVPSVLTFGPLITPGLGDWMGGAIGYDVGHGAAWAVVGIVMLLADIVPEQILVRH